MESMSFVFADRATVPGYVGLDAQDEILKHISSLGADKILLITEEAVDNLYSDYFLALSAEASPGEAPADDDSRPVVEKFVLPGGDASKSWDYLSKLVAWAFEVGASKRSVVVVFGGGAVMNVSGLFASIAFRGMKLVYVPTTLLAMHDVTTSLKTSICFAGRKNNIGSFYAPIKILIDVGFCRTLPRAELFSGLGELAKNAALLGGKHADGFVEVLSKGPTDARNGGSGEEYSIDDRTLMKLVKLGIEAKMSVLAEDALEKTSGMIFEYGHTVSHAIEKAYGDGVVPHGVGVVYGMLSSSFVAERTGIMDAKDRYRHDELCRLLTRRWPLPEPLPSVRTVMELAMKDSKRGITMEGPDEISDVLLYSMGEVVPTKTSNLSKFPSALVAEWLAAQGFAEEPEAGTELLDQKQGNLNTLACDPLAKGESMIISKTPNPRTQEAGHMLAKGGA